MVTCEATNVPHPDAGNCVDPKSTDHDGTHEKCGPCAVIASRHVILLTRAIHNPQGLSPYQFTRGMSKDDALQFWNDAKALGFIRTGTTKRGAHQYALPSYEVKR